MTGCNKNEPEQPAKVQTYHVSIQAGKGEANQQNGPRKALGLSGNTLTASWAAGEEVTVRNVTKGADLVGSLVAQSNGVQTTISGDLTGTINAGDVLELKFLSPNYTTQSGTIEYIAANCDYAVATVHVASVTYGSITFDEGIANFQNQQAIVKFTLKDETEAALNCTTLFVDVNGATYTITPPSARNEIFVALPGFSDQTVKLTATVGSEKYTYTSPSAKTFDNGKYYVITVGMKSKVYGFSIDDTHQIEFAHGNLQYNKAATSTPKWRIAEHQYDIVGDNAAFLTFGGTYNPDNCHNIGNVFIGSDKCSNTAGPTQMSEDCWIDLLSWQGKNIENDPLNMDMGEAYFTQDGFVDWGKHEIYDPLSGDTYSANTWYTLNRDQWEHILFGRDNAGELCTLASIDGVTNGNVKGIMLLPDDFVCPSGITPPTPINAFCNLLNDGSPYYQYPDRVNLGNYIVAEQMINSSLESSPTYMYNKNRYTVEEWKILEAAGAVFLPAAGRRERRIDWGGDYVMYTAIEAAYWTSKLRTDDPSYVEPNYISANAEISESLDANKTFRANCGMSVRLVRDLQ